MRYWVCIKNTSCVHLSVFFLLQVYLRRSLFATSSTKFGMTHVQGPRGRLFGFPQQYPLPPLQTIQAIQMIQVIQMIHSTWLELRLLDTSRYFPDILYAQ